MKQNILAALALFVQIINDFAIFLFQDPSSAAAQQSNFHSPKGRNSLVEKIGKTLNKLTTNHHQSHQVKHQALPPSVASTAAWIYPATFYQHQPRIGESYLCSQTNKKAYYVCTLCRTSKKFKK